MHCACSWLWVIAQWAQIIPWEDCHAEIVCGGLPVHTYGRVESKRWYISESSPQQFAVLPVTSKPQSSPCYVRHHNKWY